MTLRTAMSVLLLATPVGALAEVPLWAEPMVSNGQAVLETQLEKVAERVVVEPIQQVLRNRCRGESPVVQSAEVVNPSVAARMSVRSAVQCPTSGGTRSVTTWYSVIAEADVPVAARQIPAGSSITPSDIKMDRRDLARLRGSPVRSDALTTAVRNTVPLREGDVLLSSQIEPLPDVVGGEPAVATYRVGAMSLQFPVVAKSDGNRGQVVMVQRGHSPEKIAARVSARGQVELNP